MQVNMLEAKNQLSKLVKAALDGEEVIIANHGKPVVRLVRRAHPVKTRGYGAWKDLPAPAHDWDSPATNAALARRVLGGPIEPCEAVGAPHGLAPATKAVTGVTVPARKRSL